MSILETEEGFAEMLRDLFDYANVTVKDVSRLAGVTERTIKHWLDGESQPSPSTLFRLFRLLNVPMQPFLRDRGSAYNVEDDRQAILHYINNVASAEELRDMRFNVTVKHGSSVACQLAMVSMLNHMKLRYRLMVAKVVLNLWELARMEGGLQYDDDCIPNVDKVMDATIKTHQALKAGRQSYTDI